MTQVLRFCRRLWLSVHVQADAFRFAPIAYLQAIAWRVRGLRVRSRNRLAALAGRSSHAYALWIERHDSSAPEPSLSPDSACIQVVIDCRQSVSELQATLRSVRDTGLTTRPILVGDTQSAPRHCIQRALEIGKLVPHSSIWLLTMQAGDLLARDSGAIYARALRRAGDASIIYADDDLMDVRGRRHSPHFKPDWNPELYEHHDFVTGSCIVRVDRSTIADLPDEGWAEAIVQTAIKSGGTPRHVQHVLHHRRSRPAPSVPAKPASFAGSNVPVSVIIPTRNADELLRMCLTGVRQTRYDGLETIVVDNGSDQPRALEYLAMLEAEGVTVIRLPGPFNYSALNNAAVRTARGHLLCLLNNDVEMTDADWLSLLVMHAVKPDIGAVGARLLYPDGSIQHAGVFTGIGGGAAHGHRYQQAEERGYFERARLPQRVSAVTAACMVVARDKFLAVGGFDEINFPVAFNDVDLCLRLNSRGWQSFYEPRSTLIHHESKSRGSDRARSNRNRFAGELAALKKIWRTDQVPDPYHNRNLSPFCEQFLVGV